MHCKLSSKLKKVFSVIGWIFTGLIALLLVFIMVQKISGRTPELFGFRMFRVLTDSMEPELMVGDVILVKDVPVEDLEVGDAVTYYSQTLNGQPVTHRMIALPDQHEDGTFTMYTKGIREGAAEDQPFSSEHYIGKVVNKLPVLTFIYKLFMNKIGIIIILIPLAVIVIVEILKIGKKSQKEDGNGEQEGENPTDKEPEEKQ